MFLLNTKRRPQIPQPISVFLNTDIQKSMLDVPNPPSAALSWKQQQPSPGCSHILSCASRSPVSPCTRGKHTVQSICAAGVVKIYSRRKSGGDFMSTSHGHVLLPPTCPAAMAGGDTGLQPVALGKSVSPQLLGWREKVVLYLGYCPSWGSFIFSAVHSYGHGHSLSWNRVPVLAVQLHGNEVKSLSFTSEFSFFSRYHILFII